MYTDILHQFASDNNCEFHNKTTINLEDMTDQEVKSWLSENGFEQSRIRKEKWINFTTHEELYYDSFVRFLQRLGL